MPSLSGVFNVQEFTDLGGPLIGGRLYTYAYGTTTQKTAYTDPAGLVPHTYTADGLGGQYIALNSRGELPGSLYLAAGSYDLALKTSAGVTVWTRRADPQDDSINRLRSDLSGTGGAVLIGKTGGGTAQDAIDVLDDFPSFATGTVAAVVAANPLAKIRVPLGETLFNEIQLNGQSLDGSGVESVIKAAPGADYAIRLGYINSPSQWARRAIRDLVIDGNTKLSNGVEYGSATNTEISGRWTLECVTLTACAKCVHKPTGNIGNSYRNVNFTRSDYGVYAVGQPSGLVMHAGNDTYEDVEFSFNALAGVYYNSTVNGSGGLMFGKNTIFQFNPGFAVFIKNWESSYTPVTFDGVWFEGNYSSPSVTIDGTSYVPVDVHLENVAHAVMVNGIVPSIRLINSRLRIDNCQIQLNVTVIEKDTASVLTASNAFVDGGLHRIDIDSVIHLNRPSGNFAAAWWAPPRSVFVSDTFGRVYSIPFTSSVTFGGTHTPSTSVVSDGRIYSTCGELAVPASATLTAGITVATLTAGKWAVLTIDVKHISGTLAQLTVGQVSAQNLIGNYAPLFVTGEWKTITCIAQVQTSGSVAMFIVNGAAGSQVLRLSAMQLMQFDTEQEAINYYNSRGFVL